MSKNLQYVGVADRREVTAGDLSKLGLEDPNFKKTTFEPGQDYEVEDDVADVLLNSATFAGEFREAEEGEPAPKGAGTPVDSKGEVDSSRGTTSGTTGTAGATGGRRGGGTARGGATRST